MTTPQQPGQPPAGPPPIPPEYQAQAAQAVGDVQDNPGVDAGDILEQMKQGAVRAALGQFEQELAAMMAKAKANAESQTSALQAQVEALTRQLASVRAQAGPPEALQLANSLATRAHSIAIANPDLGAAHFAGVVSQAQSLADQVKAISEGTSADVTAATNTAHGIAAWFARVHPRTSQKVLEGSHAAMDELERIAELLPDLAPVATTLVKAV